MGALSVDSGGQAPARRRATAMALLMLGVLALHAWGLRTLYGLALKDKTAEVLDVPMFVRSIELPPPALQAVPPAEPAPPTAPTPATNSTATTSPTLSGKKQMDPSAALPEPAASAPPMVEAAASAPAPPPDTAALQASAPWPAPIVPPSEPMSDATAENDSGGSVVGMPVYDAKLPPSATWRYRLQRGLLSGEAQLQWALQGDGKQDPDQCPSGPWDS